MLEIGASSVFKFALAVGIFQGVFFTFGLNRIKDRAKLPSSLLSGIFLILTLSIAGRFAYDFAVHERFPHLFLFVDFCLFLFGPLFFFYTRSVLFTDFKIGKAELWHFVPGLIHLVSLAIQFSIGQGRFFELVQTRNSFLYNTWYVFEGLSILSISIYLILTLILLFRYGRREKPLGERFKIKYFGTITSLMMLSMVVWIISFANLLINGQRLVWAFDLTWLPMVLINFVIGYYMIIKPGFFKATSIRPVKEAKIVPSEQLVELGRKLTTLLEQEKPYKNPELSVNSIAQLLDVKPHVATKVMTQGLGTSFFELINSYRIKEFIKLVTEDNSNPTFLAVAYEVGFNSKTTFNKAFKKEKGLSPREYFKLNQAV